MTPCPHCADKDERIAWLESELGLQVSVSEIAAVRRGLGVRPQVAQLALALYRARNRLLTWMRLLGSIPAEYRGEESEWRLVNTLVCYLRKTLPPGAIETVWGRGYRMTEIGSEVIAGLLAPLANRTEKSEGAGLGAT